MSPALQADSLSTELQGSYLGLRRNVVSVALVTKLGEHIMGTENENS